PVAQGGEAVAPILAGVLVVADANERLLQQSHDQGEHLLAREAASSEVALGPASDAGERPCELDEAPVLRLVPHLAPARVVSVLLAAAGIAARGLDVPALDRADPDVGPCRRDGQAVEPSHPVGIGDALPIDADVVEAL